MAEQPRIHSRLNLGLVDFIAIWLKIERATGLVLRKEEVLKTLTSHYARIARVDLGSDLPQRPSELDRFARARGFRLPQNTAKALEAAMEAEIKHTHRPPTKEEEKNLDIISGFGGTTAKLPPGYKPRSLEEILGDYTGDDEPSAAPTTKPKLTAADLAKRQAATLAESAKLDKQANQEIHRKIKKVG